MGNWCSGVVYCQGLVEMCKVKLDVVWCNLPSVASKGGLELFLEYDRIPRNDIAYSQALHFE